jgi:biofilm PGA synthesis N-glycosyltransferase PgaC
MAITIFWIAVVGTAYVYAGYPFVLMVWRKLARRPVRKRYQEPSVSIVIAMHNEIESVHRKMRNCFELDYPAERLQIIVALDAPTDGTDALVRAYAAKGVDIVYSPVRRGKAASVNDGVMAARGDILVFADAKQCFESDALRELVANFADESVGAVSGELVLLDSHSCEAREGVGAYWRYEKALRAMESDIHSVPGATGAIYAVRRSLFTPLPRATLLDDVVTPMRIVLGGHRAVFDSAARAYDAVAENGREYDRKTRTLTGNYQLITQMPELLAPWRNPILVQFVSHKVGRLVVPYCMVALFISNLFLVHGVYLAALVGQVLVYGLAAAGWRMRIRGAALLPYTFVLMNWAAVTGLYRFMRGTSGIWNAPGSRESIA